MLFFLNTGKSTASARRYIKKNYTASGKNNMGVQGSSSSDCIDKMRRGFLACCKMDNDDGYATLFGSLNSEVKGHDEPEKSII